jgi:hypothetical protein
MWVKKELLTFLTDIGHEADDLGESASFLFPDSQSVFRGQLDTITLQRGLSSGKCVLQPSLCPGNSVTQSTYIVSLLNQPLHCT